MFIGFLINRLMTFAPPGRGSSVNGGRLAKIRGCAKVVLGRGSDQSRPQSDFPRGEERNALAARKSRGNRAKYCVAMRTLGPGPLWVKERTRSRGSGLRAGWSLWRPARQL